MRARRHAPRALVGFASAVAAASILGLLLLRPPAAPRQAQGDQAVADADAPQSPQTLPWNRPELLAHFAPADTARRAGALFPTLPSPLVARRAQPGAVDDPRADGWSTDVLQVKIGKRLQSILHLLESPSDLDASHLQPFLSDDFTCTRLRPRATQEVKRDGSLRILRAKPGKLPEKPRRRGAAGLAVELRALLQAGPGPGAAHKKIFRIDVGAAGAVTQAYVDFHARPGGEREEIGGLRAGAFHRVVQGSGRATEWTPPLRAQALRPSNLAAPTDTQRARVLFATRAGAGARLHGLPWRLALHGRTRRQAAVDQPLGQLVLAVRGGAARPRAPGRVAAPERRPGSGAQRRWSRRSPLRRSRRRQVAA